MNSSSETLKYALLQLTALLFLSCIRVAGVPYAKEMGQSQERILQGSYHTDYCALTGHENRRVGGVEYRNNTTILGKITCLLQYPALSLR